MQNNYIFYHFQNHIDFENIRATARLSSHELLRSYWIIKLSCSILWVKNTKFLYFTIKF